MKTIKNILLFLICMLSACGEMVNAQAPISPVRQNTNTTWIEPSTNNVWGNIGNGATLQWRQWIDSVQLFRILSGTGGYVLKSDSNQNNGYIGWQYFNNNAILNQNSAFLPGNFQISGSGKANQLYAGNPAGGTFTQIVAGGINMFAGANSLNIGLGSTLNISGNVPVNYATVLRAVNAPVGSTDVIRLADLSPYALLSGGNTFSGQQNINNSALAILNGSGPSIFLTNAGLKVGTTNNLTHNYTGYDNGSIALDNGSLFTQVLQYKNDTIADKGDIPTSLPPSGTAGGSLAGTYPNPTIASSVSLPGSPTTTTQASSDNSTKIATTAFVNLATSVSKLIPTTIKTSSYTASANDLVLTNATGGNIPITLPSAPANGTIIGVKMILGSPIYNTTVTTSGVDTINKTGGSTFFNLYNQGNAVYFQYQSSTHLWIVTGIDYTPNRQLIQNGFTFIGDSRTAHLTNSPGGNSPLIHNVSIASHWFSFANARLGHIMQMLGNYGISGDRSDQYLAPSNFNPALAINSQWFVFGYPAVNDISQAVAGYTNLNGVAVTLSNVAAVCAGNIETAALQVLAKGENVIICAEPGANALNTAATIGAVYKVNRLLNDFCQSHPNCYFWDPTGLLRINTTEGALNPLYTADGTHFNTIGESIASNSFANFIQNKIPPTDYYPNSIYDVYANGGTSIIDNALFNTLTGGSSSTVTVTGNIPSGWTLTGGSSSTTVTVTSTADPQGWGNDITLVITTTGAEVVQFYQGPPNATYLNLGEYYQAGVQALITNAVNVSMDDRVDINSNTGTTSTYDLYSQTNGVYPSQPINLSFMVNPNTYWAGSSTIGYTDHYIEFAFTAAGTITVTLKRPFFNKVL